MNLGRIIVLVSNDLVYDQRVQKTCGTLRELGWSPYVVGRELPNSDPLPKDFAGHRFRLPFSRGALFYAALNVRLAWYLLFAREPTEAIWANDLDTLWPAYWAARWRKLPLIYDSHEFFTEAAGLTGRPLQRYAWLAIERVLFPRLKSVITVNDSIADAYLERYPQGRPGRPLVVRNMPMAAPPVSETGREVFAQFSIPTDLPILILQGAFLDVDRGALEAVHALEAIPEVRLVLVGAGPEWETARALESATPRLHCLPKLPYESLRRLTAGADVGLSLDKGTHGNYYFSLPNKLFDYMHAGIPVVASPMPEVRRVVESCGIGMVITDHSPPAIAEAVRFVLATPRSDWSARCATAAASHHWSAQQDVIARAISLARR
jgi:glycosyltransferase involved in cell wall biosynthesis